jgi:hypothetical protein
MALSSISIIDKQGMIISANSDITSLYRFLRRYRLLYMSNGSYVWPTDCCSKFQCHFHCSDFLITSSMTIIVDFGYSLVFLMFAFVAATCDLVSYQVHVQYLLHTHTPFVLWVMVWRNFSWYFQYLFRCFGIFTSLGALNLYFFRCWES